MVGATQLLEATGGQVERVPAGEIVLETPLFEAEIVPLEGAGPFALGHLGFTPLGEATDSPDEDPERLERLRSPGYVD